MTNTTDAPLTRPITSLVASKCCVLAPSTRSTFSFCSHHRQPVRRGAPRRRPRRPARQPIAAVLPEMRRSSRRRAQTRQRLLQQQIPIIARAAASGPSTSASTSEQAQGDERGFVVTLDDITDLVSAQRTSAWADVARRIAHEIKNPLTPIQLSAERIRRKYGKVITDGSRGLRPMHRHDHPPGRRHQAHGRRVLVLRAHAEADARRGRPRRDRPPGRVPDAGRPSRDRHRRTTCRTSRSIARFDRRLLSQALTNIVKNATEAIAGACRRTSAASGAHPVVRLARERRRRDRHRRHRQRQGLSDREPPAAARALYDDARGGTGLGLAIVAKILEEHGGGIELLDNPDGPGRAASGCGSRRDGEIAAGARTGLAQPSDAASAGQMRHERRHPDRRRRGRHPRARRRHSRGRGPRHAHGRASSDEALAAIEARRPAPRLPRHLAAGLAARRAAGARADQGRASRPAGGDDLGPRQHRDRGLGHQGSAPTTSSRSRSRPTGWSWSPSARSKPRG